MKKNIKPPSEQVLIQKLLSGDAVAFERLVGTHQSIMVAVARAIIGEAFAEEVVQEAWISAIKALPKFEGRASLKTWLLQIVSNGAKTRLRREQRQVSLDDGWQSEPSDKFDARGHRYDDVIPWEYDTPEALLENEQLVALIDQSFQSLPPLPRAALTLYDLEGVEMPDVCNILDVTASNARVLLHRARTTLHHTIEAYRNPK